MGFSVNEKGEGVFESGREPFDHCIEVEGKRVRKHIADCELRNAD
jgi:hypothetical protein